ncbi:MAG: HGxxPAAW family protein [Actinomycetes bacterium]
MSTEHHGENHHGNTPAAWTAVLIMIVGFLVGTIGVMVAKPWLFWVGIALLAVGAIVGKVMAMMGMGKQVHSDVVA